MAVQKLTCPECSTVLRPTKPVPPGKKVKCPRCDTVFAARAVEEPEDDEVEEERPARPARKAAKAPARPKTKAAREAPKPAAASEDDDGAYAVIRDDKEADEDKPKINYAPDMSIKDLRGPAVALMTSPTNKLTLVGFIGVFGWLIFLLLLLIPAVFPITGDAVEQDVMYIGPGLSQAWPGGGGGGMGGVMGGGGAPAGGDDASKTKLAEEKPGLYEVAGVDLSVICDEAWYLFMAWLVPIILFTCYSGLVAFGAIKMQNLESWGWGMAASIMAMIPINMGGLILVTAMVVQIVLAQVFDPVGDAAFIGTIVIGLVSIEWLGSVAAGAWTMMTLFDEDVQAGFEYVGE